MPDDASVRYSRGFVHYMLNDKDQALADFTRAIELEPSAEHYAARGLVYNALKNYARAIDDYTKAIELTPEYILAYYGRGQAYEGLGALDKAHSDFAQAHKEE